MSRDARWAFVRQAARAVEAAPLRSGLLLAFVFEALTCAARFGMGLESSRDTAALAAFTGGLRIHHGYAGILLLLLGKVSRSSGAPLSRALLFALGVGLLASDLFHHFVVLKLVTGSAQFDLFYR